VFLFIIIIIIIVNLAQQYTRKEKIEDARVSKARVLINTGGVY